MVRTTSFSYSDELLDVISSEHSDPYQRLFANVLLRAIYDLLGIGCVNGFYKFAVLQHRSSALAWILSDDTDPFSYLWICELLDIPALDLRSRLEETFKEFEDHAQSRNKIFYGHGGRNVAHVKLLKKHSFIN